MYSKKKDKKNCGLLIIRNFSLITAKLLYKSTAVEFPCNTRD